MKIVVTPSIVIGDFNGGYVPHVGDMAIITTINPEKHVTWKVGQRVMGMLGDRVWNFDDRTHGMRDLATFRPLWPGEEINVRFIG